MLDLKVYGAPWCPDCTRSRALLDSRGIPFDWIDVDQDAEGLAIVRRLQNGGRTIPTIVFGDGDFMIEPSDHELAARLEQLERAVSSPRDL